jgi:hypothetical protein
VITSSRLTSPPDVSAAVKDAVRKSLGGAIKIVNRLMDDWCGRVIAAVDALAKAGPLQPALELLVRQLAKAGLSLKEQRAPASAVDAVRTTGGARRLPPMLQYPMLQYSMLQYPCPGLQNVKMCGVPCFIWHWPAACGCIPGQHAGMRPCRQQGCAAPPARS